MQIGDVEHWLGQEIRLTLRSGREFHGKLERRGGSFAVGSEAFPADEINEIHPIGVEHADIGD